MPPFLINNGDGARKFSKWVVMLQADKGIIWGEWSRWVMFLFATSMDLQNLVRAVVFSSVYVCFYEALYQSP